MCLFLGRGSPRTLQALHYRCRGEESGPGQHQERDSYSDTRACVSVRPDPESSE